jgi:hypothetical protein
MRQLSPRRICTILRGLKQLVFGLCIVLECELAWCFALSFFVYFFTATRSFALRERGL